MFSYHMFPTENIRYEFLTLTSWCNDALVPERLTVIVISNCASVFLNRKKNNLISLKIVSKAEVSVDLLYICINCLIGFS